VRDDHAKGIISPHRHPGTEKNWLPEPLSLR
jgi:hypothetical protein